jgi:hypothetical protein
MFSLTHGKPIAKTASPKPLILSIVDPDNEPKMKTPSKKKRKPKKRCCKHHHEDCYYDEYCCDDCPNVFDSSESEALGSSEDSEDLGNSEVIGVTFKTEKKLTPLPDLTGRFVSYIAGPSGSGKSTVASEMAQQFKNVFPNKPVYIFSRTDSRKDPAFAKLKPIQVTIDESLIENPIDITEEISENGCLMIFDDCGTINNDKLRKEIEKLISDAMEVGRKLDCNLIITNHLILPNDKKFARTVMNELTVLTVFPKCGSAQQIKYALKTYWGLNNKQIDDILAIKSRWLQISKSYPQYILWENGAKIL